MIVMMKMLSRRKERSKRRSKRRRRVLTRRRWMHMLLHGIVMPPLVMMMSIARRRGMLALQFKKRAPSLTLHHALWLRPLRYHPMMRVIILVIVIVMNPLKMNYSLC